MRCDLHVHTRHSGPCSLALLRRFCRESYTDPRALYEHLKRQGMGLVTVTDHDALDTAEELRRFPDFFPSEEVTCTLPTGTALHVGVYDVSERQHTEIQRRRDDLPALVAYLSEQRLLFAANHLFSSLTGRREAEDFLWVEATFPAAETRNGQMLAASNRAAVRLAGRLRLAPVGGSDAHAVASAGRTWTRVAGARTKEEFLEGLRRGLGRVEGESGSYLKLTRDVLAIGAGLAREQALAALLVPLAPLVPLFTLANYFQELVFLRRWRHLWREAPELRTQATFWRAARQKAEVPAWL